MKPLLLPAALLALAASCASTAPQGTALDQAIVDLANMAPSDHATAESDEAHAWLRRMVGEWEMTGGGWTLTETIEPMGDLWVVTRGAAPGVGATFNSMTTFGFDPALGQFVGSYVDTMQTKMWTYRGFLSEDGTTLTLETEGPSMTDPTKTALYRDQYILDDDNAKRLVSSAQDEDGTWKPFVQMSGTRVR